MSVGPASNAPAADANAIAAALRLIAEPGETFEIRAIARTKYGRGEEILSGYFREVESAARAVARRDSANVVGWYVTLNPVMPSLYARRADRLDTVGKDSTTKDNHVTKRKRILIDFDPSRPTGISSSDAEHAAALALATEAADELVQRGWPTPVLTDSGNGGHVVLAIDEDVDDGDLVERFLVAASARWGCAAGEIELKVDTGNYNPSRITKLYGTPARKGDNVAERPHRQSRVISAPDSLQPVTREQIEAFIADYLPAQEESTSTKSSHSNTRSNANTTEHPRAPKDAGAWLTAHGIAIKSTNPYSGKEGTGVLYELTTCPYNPEHGDRGEAHVIQFSRGGIVAGCHHDGCKKAGWGWGWLLDKYEPRAPRSDRQSQADHPNAPPRSEAPKSKTWSQPQPLPDNKPPVPAFPPQLLPDDLRLWVVDIAERMQCPIDIVAVAAMSALSILVANARTIFPKQRDNWRVYPVLWGAGIAPAGSLKSPAIAPFERLLTKLEIAEKERHERAMYEEMARKLVGEARERELKQAIKDSLKSGTVDVKGIAEQLRQQDEDNAKAKLRRLKTTDSTTEKLAELVENGKRRSRPMIVWCDELAFLLNSFERDGREQDRAFYLAAWSVTNHQIDRIARGSLLIRDLAVSIFGNMTPGSFARYVRDTVRGGDNDGFLQRLQIMVYPDPLTEWTYIDRKPMQVAERRAQDLFERLFALDEDDKYGRPPALHFSPDAQVFFDTWFAELERKLRQPRKLTGWDEARLSHFSKYRSLMPALALVCHLASGPGTENEDVTLFAAQRAAAWCEYLEAHALRVYALADSPVLEAQIIERIESGALRGKDLSLTTVRRRFWQKVPAAEFEDACKVLEELGWLVLNEAKGGGRGRPPVLVSFNPNVGQPS